MEDEIPKIHIDPNNTQTYNLSTIEQNEELVRIEPNGDIYVRGKLSVDDKEIVDAIREAVRKQNGF